MRDDSGGGSHIVSSSATTTARSDLLFQTSDTTWQAYNTTAATASTRRLDRPAAPTRSATTARSPPAAHGARGLALQRRVPDGPLAGAQRLRRQLHHRRRHRPPRRRAARAQGLPVGRPRRVLVRRAARERRGGADAGVNLAFFSGNEVFWKTRWENSIDGSGTPYRTLVSYKETHANAKIDSDAGVDRHLARSALQPAGRRRPAGERADRHDLHGQRPGTTAIEVPAADGKLRFWRNTRSPALAPGQTATLAAGHARLRVGRGPRQRLPAGRPDPPVRDDRERRREAAGLRVDLRRRHGDPPPDALPRAPSGALVFGAGTVQWSWGLDGNHDRGGRRAGPARCSRRRSTCSPTWACSRRRSRPGLVAAAASTDTAAPTPAITVPAAGARGRAAAYRRTITGTAADAGRRRRRRRGLGRRRRHLAPGDRAGDWSYTWTPAAPDPVTIRRSRRRRQREPQGASAGTAVTVGGRSCPCTLSAGPRPPASSDPTAPDRGRRQVPIGRAGLVTGLRFYKGTGKLGTQVGHSGARTAPGWPRPIHGRVGVGLAAGDPRRARPRGREHDLRRLVPLVGRILRREPTSSRAPSTPRRCTRRPVTTASSSTTAASPTSRRRRELLGGRRVHAGRPTARGRRCRDAERRQHGRGAGTQVTATFDEPLKPSSVNATTFRLRSGAAGPATIVYSGPTRTATLTPGAPLAAGGAYTAILSASRMRSGTRWRRTSTGRSPSRPRRRPTPVRRSAASPPTCRPALVRPVVPAVARRPGRSRWRRSERPARDPWSAHRPRLAERHAQVERQLPERRAAVPGHAPAAPRRS